MKTTNKIDLNEMSGGKDMDFLLVFGGAELIIQYRLENAGRIGHPFIDVVVARGDEPMTVDLCDKEGILIQQVDKGTALVEQILLGQKVIKRGS